MNEDDPYSAPQTDISATFATSDGLQGLDFKQLKKLYYRSCNVSCITFLLGIGLVGLVVVSALPESGFEDSVRFVLIGMAVFYAVSVIGLYSRTSWGRILGIIVCIITLINIPIGTIIGVVGLFAFFGAPELFGSDRITHKELKTEFKLQKANRKRK